MTSTHRFRLVPVAAVSLLLLAGCSSTPAAGPSPTTTKAASTLSGTVVVDAAASLTGSFQQLGDEFHRANPGVTVTFNFGGSDALAAQIVAGAPVDVFASASPATMKTVTDASDTSVAPVVFVSNSLEIAVPPANPGSIKGLSDFADASKKIALCAATVPCGAAATKVFAAAGITPAPDTLEPDVKSVLTKVQLGEVDAALVYRTDVIAAGDKVKGIEFAEAKGAITDYLIAPLKAAPNTKAGKAFIAWVLSAKGQAVLSKAGFGSPE
jgi:molybdate transport system substrate-binding protein